MAEYWLYPIQPGPQMSRRRFVAIALLILALGGVLRGLWLRADPPTTSVGIVWHDEGAWTHNARNRALWGTWTTDRWNPVYIAPVFTAFEFAAFKTFGVGTWQARAVPAVSGLVAVAALIAGLMMLTGDARVALAGGLLLATEYTWVMWNRAALMESTMTMFMVVAWAAYAASLKRPAWGLLAGAAAALAWFTKASAAFFVAAIVLDAVVTLGAQGLKTRGSIEPHAAEQRRGAWWTLAGGAVVSGVIGLVFVWPHWTDYWFYNVQMSLERKPSYDLRSLIDRASWLPLSQDIFTRMWPLLVAASLAIGGMFGRLRHLRPAERLLVWWVLLGLLELIAHDAGNQRRYVMFVPPVVALASMAIVAGWIRSETAAKVSRRALLLFAPIAIGLAYLVIGAALRPVLVDQAVDHPYMLAVRLSLALAIGTVAIVIIWWPRIARWLSTHGLLLPVASVALIGAVVLWNLGLYTRWAVDRTELNYRASIALGQILPPGTWVQGKLANGMDLENRIKPIFVGRGFGNYDDRFDRDDARYILTYDLPSLGYESQHEGGLIREILDRYPQHQPVATFDVEETPGPDRAVLIDKHARH